MDGNVITLAIRKQSLVYNLRVPGRVGSVDIFEALFGRGMTAASTEVIVITKLALSKHILGGKNPRRYEGGLQVYIDNKPYFVKPNGKPRSLSNMVIPDNGPQFVDPDMKILVPPSSGWRVVLWHRTPMKKRERVRFMMRYTLYDGRDAEEMVKKYGLDGKKTKKVVVS